jgi:hypothetical protein
MLLKNEQDSQTDPLPDLLPVSETLPSGRGNKPRWSENSFCQMASARSLALILYDCIKPSRYDRGHALGFADASRKSLAE